MPHESLQVLLTLIEQAMAGGFFKRLQDLDFVREHFANIETHILNQQNQKPMFTKEDLDQEIDAILRTRNEPNSIHRGELSNLLNKLVVNCCAQPMDAFLIAGQSNARGKGTASQSPNPDPNTVYHFTGGNVVPVTDEVGFTEGSAWPSMGITWFQMAGRRICFVNLAVDSTSLSPAVNNNGAGDWSPNGVHFQSSITKTQTMLQKIEELGFLPHFRGVLWGQGESDAAGINVGTTTKSDYKDQLRTLMAGYRTAFGSNMPFYIVKTGTRTNENDPGYADIRAGQEDIVAEDPLRNKFIYIDTLGFVARNLMKDVVHYNQIAQNEIGRQAAAVILGGKNPL